MAIERELKLALPGDLPAPRANALIAHLDRLPGAEARGERHLVNRYFDTPDLALARAKAALRLRYVARDGHPGQWLQTLKSVGEARNGLHVRHEWEQAVHGEALELAPLIAACDMPATAALLRDEGTRVVAQFETNFVRRLWRYIAGDGTTVEIAFDRGEVAVEAAGVRHTEPLMEVELELLDAPDDDRSAQGERILNALAQDLRAVLPELHADDVSKAQRGYRLRQKVLGG
ncbi:MULTISPECIES: CYTH domain-containing protein [Pandoraea]|uniref:CYTH domain-containing protein n=1 Tax=Pandoraea TaxID=93217 RepID=UPI001F5E0CCA|nr:MULTISPECIES: CYTH domain-containing protein [Pandoraea]MCI3204818.1 CYTH domain-containing protein [Pandoraea sp. LA3]MDN4582846.1 CYTH domain-containing protein [Pandoraea capi]